MSQTSIIPSTIPINGDIPKSAIVEASTLNDVIRAARADPQIKAAFMQAFGTQLAEAQKSPWGMIAGALIGWLGTRYGISLDPSAQAIAAGVLAILGGDIWQWASARWWPSKAITTIAAQAAPAKGTTV